MSMARAVGATGRLSLRGGSDFYNREVVGACQKANLRFPITAKMSKSQTRRGKVDPRGTVTCNHETAEEISTRGLPRTTTL